MQYGIAWTPLGDDRLITSNSFGSLLLFYITLIEINLWST